MRILKEPEYREEKSHGAHVITLHLYQYDLVTYKWLINLFTSSILYFDFSIFIFWSYLSLGRMPGSYNIKGHRSDKTNKQIFGSIHLIGLITIRLIGLVELINKSNPNSFIIRLSYYESTTNRVELRFVYSSFRKI